ncbi:MAG: S41 family peptidase [Planctomycetota bacterium]|jgi:carboxyl-terminal processing protease
MALVKRVLVSRAAWVWVVVCLLAVISCEPQAPVSAPTIEPTDQSAVEPAVIEPAGPADVEPSVPAAPEEVEPLWADALSAAQDGQFDEALEKVRLAGAAAPDDPRLAPTVDLLESYLDHQQRAEAQRAAEYAQAVDRVQRAMMVQTYLADKDNGKMLTSLREQVDTLNDIYQRVTTPDTLRDVPAEQARMMTDESLAALAEAIDAVKAIRKAVDDHGPYGTEFLLVAETLSDELQRFRQAWAEADLGTPQAQEASARRIRAFESDLAEAMSDVDVMVSKQPWRTALVQGAMAKKVASPADHVGEQAWYVQLLKDIERRGQDMIGQAEWPAALVAYRGLETIEPDNEDFKRTSKLVRKHVRMLGLYGDLDAKDATVDAADDSGDDDDEGEVGDDADAGETPAPRETWRQMVRGVSEQTVRSIITRVDSYYVTDVDYAKLIRGALTSVQVLAETPQVAGTFEGLADETQRRAFLDVIEQAVNALPAPRSEADKLDRLDLVVALKTVLESSEQTVKLPVGVLAVEFVEGFLGELDEFSSPIWPDQISQFNKLTRGHFVGVGIQVQKEPGEPLKVVTPMAGTPAFRAGIRMGDQIMAVDGKPTRDLPIDDIIEMIMGEKGTTVVLQVRRRGTVKLIDVPIVRDTIKILTIKGWRHTPDGEWDFMLDPDHRIGYIRVARFTEETAADLAEALKTVRRQGAESLILDLRLNPGGLLRAATRTVDEFVGGGQIVMTRGRKSQRTEARATWRGQYVKGPVLILIDEYTASASEIVSGALQDMGRARVLGQRSFGKGSVQQVLLVGSPSAQALLKLTAAYYYVGPSEKLVHRQNGAKEWGVEPDVAVAMTPQQLKAWLEIRHETDLLHEVNPEQVEADLARQLDADLQLTAALTMLRMQHLATQGADQAAR